VHQSDLPPVPGSVHKKIRVGRGNASGKGTTGGRGTKGQQSRSGRGARVGFEGGQNPLIRALSRRRGFQNRFRVEYEPINVGELAKLPAGSEVTVSSLRTAGIVKSARLPVKILGGGEIKVALKFEADRVSASARSKIEAAGGSVTELNPAPVKEEKAAPAPRASRAADDDDDEEEASESTEESET
jgi:large subunit ribosomal protein L15